MNSVQRGPATAVVALLGALAVLDALVGIGPAGLAVGALTGLCAAVALGVGLRRSCARRLGAANVVTLVRATLGQLVAALVAAELTGYAHRGLLVAVAAVALVLDLVDGKVARGTGGVTRLGARFDMEADAFLILVLSVGVAAATGWWVLAVGAARYALWLAERFWPWLRRSVPPRQWRKVVAAVQGVVLTVAVTAVLPAPVTQAVLAIALVLLAESFGRDVWWLARCPAGALGGRPGVLGITGHIADAAAGTTVSSIRPATRPVTPGVAAVPTLSGPRG